MITVLSGFEGHKVLSPHLIIVFIQRVRAEMVDGSRLEKICVE